MSKECIACLFIYAIVSGAPVKMDGHSGKWWGRCKLQRWGECILELSD